MARLLPWVLALSISGSVALAADSARTVIVVRHAERESGMMATAGISEVGRCRAGVLADVLADAHVSRIFVSEVERTQQTADPLAKKLNIKPEVTPASETPALIAKLNAGAPGSVALVVGHSNTVPEIVKRLGGGEVRPIADTEFDRLWVVTLTAPDQAKAIELHYPGCSTVH